MRVTRSSLALLSPAGDGLGGGGAVQRLLGLVCVQLRQFQRPGDALVVLEPVSLCTPLAQVDLSAEISDICCLLL